MSSSFLSSEKRRHPNDFRTSSHGVSWDASPPTGYVCPTADLTTPITDGSESVQGDEIGDDTLETYGAPWPTDSTVLPTESLHGIPESAAWGSGETTETGAGLPSLSDLARLEQLVIDCTRETAVLRQDLQQLQHLRRHSPASGGISSAQWSQLTQQSRETFRWVVALALVLAMVVVLALIAVGSIFVFLGGTEAHGLRVGGDSTNWRQRADQLAGELDATQARERRRAIADTRAYDVVRLIDLGDARQAIQVFDALDRADCSKAVIHLLERQIDDLRRQEALHLAKTARDAFARKNWGKARHAAAEAEKYSADIAEREDMAFVRAVATFRLGDYREAIPLLSAVARTRRSRDDADEMRLHIGEALEKLGQTEGARAHYSTMLAELREGKYKAIARARLAALSPDPSPASDRVPPAVRKPSRTKEKTPPPAKPTKSRRKTPPVAAPPSEKLESSVPSEPSAFPPLAFR